MSYNLSTGVKMYSGILSNEINEIPTAAVLLVLTRVIISAGESEDE